MQRSLIMTRRLMLATAACGMVGMVVPSDARAQERPDFSGDWYLQVERSAPPVDVWGQTRPHRLTIRQSAAELVLETEGGGLPVPTAAQRFRLDGTVHEFADDSLGDLGPFRRRVRTEARWDGARLTLLIEPFGETADAGGRTRAAGSITRVWTLWLTDDGLRLARTGCRAAPPRLLHGRPYARTDDRVYNRDEAVYLRAR